MIYETFAALWRSFQKRDVQSALAAIEERRNILHRYRQHPQNEIRNRARELLQLLEEAEKVLQEQPDSFEQWLETQAKIWQPSAKAEESSDDLEPKTLWRCHNCEKDNEPYSVACTHCGTSLVRECIACDAITLLAADICHKCGASEQAYIKEHETKAIAYARHVFEMTARIREDLRQAINLPIIEKMLSDLDQLQQRQGALKIVSAKISKVIQKTTQTIKQTRHDVISRPDAVARQLVFEGRPMLATYWLKRMEQFDSLYTNSASRKLAGWAAVIKTGILMFIGAAFLLVLGLVMKPTVQLPDRLQLLAPADSDPFLQLLPVIYLSLVGAGIGLASAITFELNPLLGLGSIFVVGLVFMWMVVSDNLAVFILSFLHLVPLLYGYLAAKTFVKYGRSKVGQGFALGRFNYWYIFWAGLCGGCVPSCAALVGMTITRQELLMSETLSGRYFGTMTLLIGIAVGQLTIGMLWAGANKGFWVMLIIAIGLSIWVGAVWPKGASF